MVSRPCQGPRVARKTWTLVGIELRKNTVCTAPISLGLGTYANETCLLPEISFGAIVLAGAFEYVDNLYSTEL